MCNFYTQRVLSKLIKRGDGIHLTTHLFLEVRALVGCHCVCLGDYGNNVYFVVKSLHKLHIEWLESMARRRYEVETAVDPVVGHLVPRHARLGVKELLVFVFDVFDDRYPTVQIQKKIKIELILKSYWQRTNCCCQQHRRIPVCRQPSMWDSRRSPWAILYSSRLPRFS